MPENTDILPPLWTRLVHRGQPVYIQPDGPEWLAPTSHGDQLLQALTNTSTLTQALARLQEQNGTDSIPNHHLSLELDRLQQTLQANCQPAYRGRGQELSLGKLKECWFHLTDRCNLSCRHCLFAASPQQKATLTRDLLDSATAQALELGCQLLYFTGGEPFVYPGFLPWLDTILRANPQVHGIILTNGMLLGPQLPLLRQMERLHLQISLDGLETAHDHLRGAGSFRKLLENLHLLRQAQIPFTLSVAISRINIADLTALTELAGEIGAASIHLLYHFIRGKGSREQFVPPAVIFPHLLAAWKRADELGLPIDNIEILRGQVFSTPGTRHDLSNAGWESLAIGPDGSVFPSPALVGMAAANCGHISTGLATVWQKSPVLTSLRHTSLLDAPGLRENPLRFITGGGDIDHSFMTGGHWVGHDPYLELYEKIALELITRQAEATGSPSAGTIALRMGDIRHDCPDPESAGSSVTLTHCNCVISLASDNGHAQVREFYGQAALDVSEDITNPLAPAQNQASYIPEAARKRSYGCGSPVTDAAPQPGETLVDLGSGSGVECFMAAAAVGARGKVFGIDMTDAMLELARTSKQEVVARLGYDNVEFRKGFLEQIPLEDGCADIVISNCVINLSPDKRRTYREIHRILKPGGRLVISDITTDTAIPPAIRNHVRYRGECLGGAMQQEELVDMLEGTGFAAIHLIKRFPYRQVEGMDFFSLTYEAQRPLNEINASDTGPSPACGRSSSIPGLHDTGPSLACGRSSSIPGLHDTGPSLACVYRGPYKGIYTESGILLVKGRRTMIPEADADLLDDSVFLLDNSGAVTNIPMTATCCVSPTVTASATGEKATGPRQEKGCMCCGAELRYFHEPQSMVCHYCGVTHLADGCCVQGHFVCDRCHQENGLEVIRSICTSTTEQDLISLLVLIRSHPAIPMHGPEHHAMIPGILLACYRNCGGKIGPTEILTAINRGADVPGGVCGFWGACGAAIGIGIGVATIFAATPLTPGPRQLAQEFSGQILLALASRKGGRCCQRETYIALKETARLSARLLPVALQASGKLQCDQYLHNRECIRKQCPLWDTRIQTEPGKTKPLTVPLAT